MNSYTKLVLQRDRTGKRPSYWRAEIQQPDGSFKRMSLFNTRDPRCKHPDALPQTDKLRASWRKAAAGQQEKVRESAAALRAQQLANELQEEHDRRRKEEESRSNISLRELVEQELRAPGKNGRSRSPATISGMRLEFERFHSWMDEHHPSAITDFHSVTALHAGEFHRHLVAKGLAQATRRRIVGYLKRLFEARVELEQESGYRNPFARVKVAGARSQEKRHEIQERALDDGEIEGLLLAAQHPDAPEYLHSLLTLFLGTGARKGEVIETSFQDATGKRMYRPGLRWSAINWQEDYLTLTGKTGPRPVPLTPELREALEAYRRVLIQAQQLSEYIFVRDRLGPDGQPVPLRDFRGALKAACRRAGITRRVRPHDLRHSALSRYARQGLPPALVQRLAGHANSAMTDHYCHTNRDQLLRGVARVRNSSNRYANDTQIDSVGGGSVREQS